MGKKKTKERSRELVSPATRSKITRIVCHGLCVKCKEYPQVCVCLKPDVRHVFLGSRRGVRILMELIEQSDRNATRIRYRAFFPAIVHRGAAEWRTPAATLNGMAHTVFSAIASIQHEYERRQLRTWE